VLITPPGLLGAAVLFWGWQTGLLLAAAPMALALEAARRIGWRWDLARTDVTRLADLCRVVLAAMAIYLWATRGTARAVLGLVVWFPIAVLPLVLAQAYATGDRIDLRTFFLIFRRRGAGADEVVNLAYPYLVLCLAAASAANVRTPAFYAVVCGLAAWALWPARPRAFHGVVWAGMLLVAAGAGWAGHVGLHAFQSVVEAAMAEWMFDYAGRNPDPFQSRTAIGSLGRLKLSDRILIRVDTGGPLARPLLLHEASYDVYNAGLWGTTDTEFASVPPQIDRRTWDLLPAPPGGAAGAVDIAAYTRRGRGMVAVPGGTYRLEGLLALQMKRNRLGAVKVEDALGLVTYRARFVPGRVPAGPPTETDLRIPRQEAPVLHGIAGDLGLAGRPPGEAIDVVRRYFAGGFRYATYLDGVRRGSTALADFFLRSRAGHCEYFATATVLLLRAAGIPARYAVGYSVQEWSPREGRHVVRARHGHAWALAWANGGWREVDTTPPVWTSVEAADRPLWEPLADLASWAMFLFSRWRYADQQSSLLGDVGWLLVPLVAFLAWRLYRQRRVARVAAAEAPAVAPVARPGGDSEFYRVEAHLAALGLGRHPWEPVGPWLARLADSRPGGVGLERLPSLAALHYRHRFDPLGLDAAEREALRAGVAAWLAHREAVLEK
jgi:transglutaminase-like putative cysteine protease